MEFIRKNFVTILVVGATVVLGGVAVFTAMRLYQLRDSGVTPVEPELSSADEAPVGTRPASGNWDLPEMFIVTNTSDSDVELVWQIDCWDETICEDSRGTETLAPGQSIEEGLGAICSQWQLDINYSGTATETTDVWDWAGVSQIAPDCDFDLNDATDSGDLDEDDNQFRQEQVESPQPPVTTTSSDYEVTQCTVLSFSTEEDTGIGGTGETASPSATAIATATPSTAPTATSTAVATATPAATDSPALPDAGVGLPTILGVGFGALLLIAAMALAL